MASTTRQDGNVQGDMLFVFLKISLRGFFISKSNNIFVYFLEDEVGLENRNSIGYKRKREAQATDVMTCDKDVERQAEAENISVTIVHAYGLRLLIAKKNTLILV